MTTVAIAQPTYLGWQGYYRMLDQADVFIILDTVEFSRQSWQQRNRIRLTTGQLVWLTVPVQAQAHQPIGETRIANDRAWQRKHWGTIQAAYGRAAHWDILAWLEEVYQHDWYLLSELNGCLIEGLAEQFAIDTKIVRASELGSTRAGRTERLIDLCRLVDADTLLEPIGGQYLANQDLDGIRLEWFDYQPRPYDQGGQEWVSHLSILDLLAHHGPGAISHIRDPA